MISLSGGWELNVWVFVNPILSPVVHEIEGSQVLLDYTVPNVSQVKSILSICKASVSLECTFCSSVLNRLYIFSLGQRVPADTIFNHPQLLRSAPPRPWAELAAVSWHHDPFPADQHWGTSHIRTLKNHCLCNQARARHRQNYHFPAESWELEAGIGGKEGGEEP